MPQIDARAVNAPEVVAEQGPYVTLSQFYRPRKSESTAVAFRGFRGHHTQFFRVTYSVPGTPSQMVASSVRSLLDLYQGRPTGSRRGRIALAGGAAMSESRSMTDLATQSPKRSDELNIIPCFPNW